MEDIIRDELLLFSHVLDNLCKDDLPLLPRYLMHQLLSAPFWTVECIDNRITWYTTVYYVHYSLGETPSQIKDILLEQLAHLIQEEKKTKSLCIDPAQIDTADEIAIPIEIHAYLCKNAKKD